MFETWHILTRESKLLNRHIRVKDTIIPPPRRDDDAPAAARAFFLLLLSSQSSIIIVVDHHILHILLLLLYNNFFFFYYIGTDRYKCNTTVRFLLLVIFFIFLVAIKIYYYWKWREEEKIDSIFRILLYQVMGQLLLLLRYLNTEIINYVKISFSIGRFSIAFYYVLDYYR